MAGSRQTGVGGSVAEKAGNAQPGRRGVSDSAVLIRTGQPLAHWFAVLDHFGAPKKGHTASARHLEEEHGVGAWYAQGITVAYERARGLRVANQGSDGKFQVSVSRTIPADVPRILRQMGEGGWLQGTDTDLVAVHEEALARPEGVRINRLGDAALRYRWGGRAVEITVTGKGGGRSLAAVQLRGLAGPGEVEEQRAMWTRCLELLKSDFEPA